MHTHRMGLGLVLITTQMVLACATVGSAGSGDALTDTGWKLSALPGQTSLTGRPATLHFSEGRVHGSDGCNRYSGTYNAAGEKFSINENLASTKMACPEPLMRQTEAFTRALTKASAWRKEAGHLVLLDSGAYELASQRSWLEADLVAARARGVRAIIAATHDGPWSRGIHGGSELARREIVPLLVRHRVDLLLSGHDHLYQRGRADGLNYLVSGGGGASLYPVKCGVRGRPRCRVDDGATLARSAHHYLLVTIGARQLELCPRLLDGSPLEPCTTLALAAPAPP